MLHREFEVDTAVSGEQGLTLIRDRGPYSVVISGYADAGMNGAQFLAQVRQRAPDTIRMLLTGFTDIDAAMEAVNQGNIFRFLAKPCERRFWSEPSTPGVYQYRLVMVERELLEKYSYGERQGADGCLKRRKSRGFWKIDAYNALCSPSDRQVQSAFSVAFRDRGHAVAVGCVTLDLGVMAGGVRWKASLR